MARPSRPMPLLLAGLLLLLLGGAWSSIDRVGYLPRLVSVSGAVVLVFFLVRHAGEIRFLLLQAREHSEPGPTTTLLLAGLVLGLGALLAHRTLLPRDLTSEGFNSLSPGTMTALRALEAPLDLDAFCAGESADWERAARYLELYARSSTRVRTSLADPDREPDRARSLGITRSGVVVVSSGAARAEVLEIEESAITQGILRVLEGRRRRVGFLQRHGEPRLSAGGDEGLTALVQDLSAQNIDSEEVSLLGADEGLAGLDALLIVHPRQALYGHEVSQIREYLDRGGRVGLWLEPGDSTGLEGYLARLSLEVLPGVVRDRGRIAASLDLGDWATPLVGAPEHALTARLATFAVAMQARPLRILSPHPMDLFINPILKTARHPQDRDDALLVVAAVSPGAATLAQGPQVIGAALSWEIPVGESWRADRDASGLPPVKPLARLAVFGDAGLLSNRYLGVGSNRELARNTLHWLTDQERFLDISPPSAESGRLRIGRQGLRALLYGLEFGLPLLLLGLGAAVWLRRRGGGG